ncbi:hypothetical protein AB0O47_39945 [Streptomyces noursei]|uniref:hypothetical protein n=1 Tax=Streptomyces noursei TaxID=1971 RepID=UPI00344B9A1B
MEPLVTEQPLRDFLTAIGLDEQQLNALDHEALLGCASACLDLEGRHRRTPGIANPYGHKGYAEALRGITDRTPVTGDRFLKPATLSIRAAEQNIGRAMSLIRDLEPADEESPNLAYPFLSLLYAAGILINLANNQHDAATYKNALRDAANRIAGARSGLHDIKRALKAQGVTL